VAHSGFGILPLHALEHPDDSGDQTVVWIVISIVVVGAILWFFRDRKGEFDNYHEV
jgi:hypothetical protein